MRVWAAATYLIRFGGPISQPGGGQLLWFLFSCSGLRGDRKVTWRWNRGNLNLPTRHPVA